MITHRNLSHAASLCILILSGSCSTDSTTERAAVRDSAGIQIVETAGPVAEWRLSPEPVLQIGVVDGDDVYQFSSIAFARRLSDGRYVVADHQSHQIRFFDPAGKHSLSVGRRGAGPGEFKSFGDIVLTGDSVLVYDAANRRLVLIAPDGSVAEEQSVQGHPAFSSFNLGHNVIGVTRDGRMVIALPPRPNPPPVVNAPVYGRDTVAIVVSSRRGEAFDTIARIAGGEFLFKDPATSGMGAPGRRGGWYRSGVTFGYYPLYVITQDALVYATSERAGFEVMRLSGAVHGNRAIRIVRRTDTHAVRVSEVADRYVEWVGEPSPGYKPGDAVAAMASARAQIDALPRDHLVPFIDRMIADSETRIWQQDRVMPWDPDETPRTWIIYAPGGDALARIVIPWNFRITQITGDHVVGVSRDDADVPFVTVYRIVRPVI